MNPTFQGGSSRPIEIEDVLLDEIEDYFDSAVSERAECSLLVADSPPNEVAAHSLRARVCRSGVLLTCRQDLIFFDKKPASPEMQTKDIWIYDFRTNIHFTLKQHPMVDADLADFIKCYHPENRHERTETWSEENTDGRWRKFTVDEIMKRDKISLDIFWIKDKSLADLDSLPDPDVLAADIIENLQSAIDSFNELMESLRSQDTNALREIT